MEKLINEIKRKIRNEVVKTTERKVSRRKYVAVAGAAVAAAAIGGAAYYLSQPGPPAPTPTPTPTPTVTPTATPTPTSTPLVVLSQMYGEPDPAVMDMLDALNREFESLTGIKMTVVPFGGTELDYGQKYTALAMAGQLPDVPFMQPSLPVVDYQKNGWLAPVEDVIEEIEADLGDMWPILKEYSSWGGHNWWINLNANGNCFWYRKDIAEEAGITNYPPADYHTWTWEKHIDMLEAFESVTNPTTGEPWYAGGMWWYGGGSQFIMWRFFANGGHYTDPDENIILDQGENKEAMITAIKEIQELDKHCLPAWRGLGGGTRITTLTKELGAGLIDQGRVLSWILNDAPELEDKVGLGPLPRGQLADGPYGYGYVHTGWEGWSLSGQTKHPKEAKEYLKYFYTSDHYFKYFHTVPLHYLPPFKNMVDDPRFITGKIKEHKDWLDIYMETFQHAVIPFKEWGAKQKTINTWILGVLYGPDNREFMRKVLDHEGTPEELVSWLTNKLKGAKSAMG